ncbi:RRP15-like protein [Tribolium madens]|uniref:RRP15-like protein n=1 Tax=Tribolium madens TaxID=41895 RepID=UPI001CF761B7|nr:RRP15-like protein [Tribolium madens]
MTIMPKVIETNDSEESVASSENEVESVVSDTDNTPGTTNAGWADSIAKILKTNKPKGKKTLVLSKAKKLTDVKRKKTVPTGFEVATADGDVKQEEIEVEDNETSEQSIKRKKQELPNLRVKPNILEKDRERTLSKIATRGVVQLFNAVRTQQKDISKKLDEAGPLEVRKEKVLKSIDKRAFLDVLMGEKSQVVSDKADNSIQKSEESTWSVLRDDFMMGAKMKDWDKELEEEMETEQQAEVESE